MFYIALYQTGPGPAPGACQEKKSKKSFMPTAKKNSVGTQIVPKKIKKKSQKKVDRTEKSLILFRMNLINSLPRSAAEEIAALSPAEIAEMEAFFAFVDSVNDEAEAAWDRFAADVDAGAR